MIGTQPGLASPAIDHRVSKGIDVTARFQHRRMGQDRAVQSDDVVALPHHHLPPILFKIIFEFDSKWPVIPHPVESAINLARLENEPAPFAQADNLLHPLRVLFPSHVRTYLTADHADETDFSINILSLIPVLLSLRAGTPFGTSGGLSV